MNKEVAILMATYNGEKYLEEQIESIIDQTYKNWILYIRDDNSQDDTQKIIDKYVKRYPRKIVQIKDDIIANGACKNFMCLLENVHKNKKHKMYLFCDQDDYWLKDKIEKTVNEYFKIINNEKPILIHTDLYVVDSKLNLISNSFIKYSGLNGKCKKFNNYLIENNATGCTMLINDRLADLVKYNIKNIMMHDWYFALIASAFGEVVFLNKATIKYRQHSNNTLGAKTNRGFKNLYKIIKKAIKNNSIIKGIKGEKRYSDTLFKQAESFRKCYYNMLDDNKKTIIDEFCLINKSNKMTRIYRIIRYGFYKQGLIKLIGELLFL